MDLIAHSQPQGMDRNSGKPLSGLDHLRQSLIDILTTRVGERVMLRDYGSELPNLPRFWIRDIIERGCQKIFGMIQAFYLPQ